MRFEDAVARCPVRGCIYREAMPENCYNKNNPRHLAERVPQLDQAEADWQVYDPLDDLPHWGRYA